MRKVQKCGKSLREAQIEEAPTVGVPIENGGLRVHPLRTRRFNLRNLLRRITRKNLHGEIDTGELTCRELW